MQAFEVIRRLAATTSRTEKEQILFDAFMTGQRDVFTGFRMSYDPLVSYGVQKVAEIAPEDLNPTDPGTVTFQDFLTLADRLRTRKLTGYAARDAINDTAARCHGPTWNDFYRRVLLKDLRCGVTEATVNKVLKKLSGAYPEVKDLFIPVFSCQLAEDGESPQHQAKVKGKKLIDIKLDGARLLSILDIENQTVTQCMRNGKITENFVPIREKLEKVLAKLPGSIVLDGEVVSSSFQELMTQVNRQTNVDTSNAKLAVFDIIPLQDFRTGTCSISQHERHAMLVLLSDLLRTETDGSVYVVPKVEVDLETPEGRASFKEFVALAAENGLEGVMIKDPLAPYQCKRTAAWLKCKPFITVDLEVIGMEEGKPDSKYVGMLGALVCRGEDQGRAIECNVGSGLTDHQLKEFWLNQSGIIGSVVEIKADIVTKESGSDIYSLRFPRFLRFRETHVGEGKI